MQGQVSSAIYLVEGFMCRNDLQELSYEMLWMVLLESPARQDQGQPDEEAPAHTAEASISMALELPAVLARLEHA